MTGFSPRVFCGLVLLALAACGSPSGSKSAPPPTGAASAPPLPQNDLGRLVERYWDEHLSQDNVISPQILADSLSIERRYLAEVLAVPRDGLDAPSRLTYDIFRRRRELLIEGATFPGELLPINPFTGEPLRFAAQATRLALNPPASAAGYDDWLKRIDDYVRWTQQAAGNMREGMRRGYTSPRALIERMLPILERLGVDDYSNVFYAPLRSLAEGIKEPERAQLTKSLSAAVSQKVLPANRALHDFLQRDYLPRTRPGIALSELPLGTQWYAYRVKKAVGAGISPDEINRIGAAEVERLGTLLQGAATPLPPAATKPPLSATTPQPAATKAPPGATTPPSAAATPRLAPAELLGAYQAVEAQVVSAMPPLFPDAPKAEFDIRAADWLPVPAAALYYEPARGAAASPAVLYVYTGRPALKMSIAGFLQQGLPGRHLQSALQQEHADLPKFRRFGSEPAFVEGWGLYATSLGEALSAYPDEAAKLDAAAVEMRCAVALVVDTGIHAKGWTRARALDYLRAHAAMDEADAQAMVDWYAANPADGLACMMGGLKFRALRTRAQQALGSRFDIREFHAEILRDGAMPMDLLEAKMKTWSDASK
jgi:uncharacterized protein (DUF885 family)